MSKFLNCLDGNFAVVFAVSMVPVLGAAGMAVDYTRATNVQDFLQSVNDGAAISGSRLGSGNDQAGTIAYLKSATATRFGDGPWVADMNVETEWLSNFDFQVTTSLSVPVTILAAVPGFQDEVPLTVTSVVRIEEPSLVYKEPEVSDLDPEAGDYNRVEVYCFNPDAKRARDARTQMTAIADNGGTKYDFVMPRCESHETMSYKLRNVRDARTNKSRWTSKEGRYEYFTDTEIEDGKETYDLGGRAILETVLCDSIQVCKPKNQGGVIPHGKNRTPERATKPCAPGKYMYYGWEDRPPGNGWTDKDYDDIRIIVECPVTEEVGNRMVMLIR